jgi:hypothetical protein
MATRQADQACQQREKKAAEAALQQQLVTTHLKHLEEKKSWTLNESRKRSNGS